MRIRLREIVFILICLGMIGFGAILFIKADGTPVPGMLMMGMALVALILRYARNPQGAVGVFDESQKPLGQWDLEISEQQAERRRRGDYEV